MELKRLSQHIWYMPFEEERDRPNLGYVKGDNYSIAIDAGHSAAHTKEFYDLLEKEKLPLPSLTVITHWHWDHTFGMHAAAGLCLANEKTNQYLATWKEKIETSGPDEFLSMNESIRKEYEGNREVKVVKADMTFNGEITLDLGGCTVKVMQTEAPHTDDSAVIYYYFLIPFILFSDAFIHRQKFTGTVCLYLFFPCSKILICLFVSKTQSVYCMHSKSMIPVPVGYYCHTRKWEVLFFQKIIKLPCMCS